MLPFHACATNSNVPADLYYACFVMDWTGEPGLVAYKRMIAAKAPNAAAAQGTAMAPATAGSPGTQSPAAHN